MTLYIYKIGTTTPVMTLKNVLRHSDAEVVTDTGTYSPLAENLELSAKADCAGKLRAAYRADHPTAEARMNDLEALVADILFGGGTV